MEPRKQAIMTALDKFVAQRPGLEFGNYGDVSAYRSEMRGITKDRHHYNTLARAVERSDSITADMLLEASRSAYSGRLTIKLHWDAGINGAPDSLRKAAISYCTGQYFPTEYRKAACAVLASALWERARADMPGPIGYRVESWSQLGKGRTRHQIWEHRPAADADLAARGGSDYGSVNDVYVGGLSAGEWLRTRFRREFGRSIAGRWFQ